MDMEKAKEEFFGSDVIFQSDTGGIVESKHPSQKNRSWALQCLAGLIAGTVFMVAGQACATEPKIVPLEVAALEFQQHSDIQRVESQGLGVLFREGYALVERIRDGQAIGSAGLRSEVARLSMVSDAPGDGDHSNHGAFEFIVGKATSRSRRASHRAGQCHNAVVAFQKQMDKERP